MCLCVCVGVCVCVCVSLCVRLCVCLHLCVSLCVHLCVCLHLYVCVSLCVCLHLCVCASASVCVSLGVSASVCVSLCVRLCVSYAAQLCLPRAPGSSDILLNLPSTQFLVSNFRSPVKETRFQDWGRESTRGLEHLLGPDRKCSKRTGTLKGRKNQTEGALEANLGNLDKKMMTLMFYNPWNKINVYESGWMLTNIQMNK